MLTLYVVQDGGVGGLNSTSAVSTAKVECRFPINCGGMDLLGQRISRVPLTAFVVRRVSEFNTLQHSQERT